MVKSSSKNLLPLAIRGVNLPNLKLLSSPGSDLLTYCVGIDWLEFTAESKEDNLPFLPGLYQHESCGHGSKYYNELYNIYTKVDGETYQFGQLQTKPRPTFLSPRLVQFKLDNRFCYTQDIASHIERFCNDYNLEFKNITRLDLFIDFQAISGHEMEIQEFLGLCASRKIIMKAKSMSTYHSRNYITGITWGSRSSGVSVTCYNKSLEMEKKTEKPWIRKLWDMANFDRGIDTYRLEFSLKKPKTDIVNFEAETLSNFNDISLVNKVKPLIDYCINKHFQLAINEPGIRFSRLQRFYPINMEDSTYYHATWCEKPKSSNYTKAYIKRIVSDYLFYKKDDKILSNFMLDHLLITVNKHGLNAWFERKYHWLQIKDSLNTIQDLIQSTYHMKTPMKQTKIDLKQPNFLKHFYN